MGHCFSVFGSHLDQLRKTRMGYNRSKQDWEQSQDETRILEQTRTKETKENKSIADPFLKSSFEPYSTNIYLWQRAEEFKGLMEGR